MFEVRAERTTGAGTRQTLGRTDEDARAKAHNTDGVAKCRERESPMETTNYARAGYGELVQK